MPALLPALVFLPLATGTLLALLPPRWRPAVALTGGAITTALVLAVVLAVATEPITYALAGWPAPLGIELFADALSAAMLGLTALVTQAVLIYATASPTVRGGDSFWALALMLWAGLNAVYVSADLFNAYVALELMGIAAVGLVIIGGVKAWRPGLRYLFVAVLGSLIYLLGIALVYSQTGTLDLAASGQELQSGVVAATALVLVTAGMALKTALFPLHSWLPGAHSAAPAAVSPLLSALVIKASVYLLIRTWFTVFNGVAPVGLPTMLGVLGSVAVVWGTIAALRQDRAKLIVAYSTVAQVGYLFLLFAFLSGPGGPAPAAWSGVIILALSHGLAKAAMFMATGVLMMSHGSDDISGWTGAANRLPGTVAAFAIAGVALAGIPPSLGFVGKWQLLQAGMTGGQWWWLPVILLGGLLTFAYTAKVVRSTFDKPGHAGNTDAVATPRRMSAVALGMALAAMLAGFLGAPLAEFLDLAIPQAVSNP